MTEDQEPPSITSESQEKSVRTFLIVLAVVFILFILFLFFYATQKQSTMAFTYNGFSFTKAPYGYGIELYINQATFPVVVNIRNSPVDLETIPVENNVHFLLEKEHLYVAIDPEENLTGKTTIAALEVDSFLDNPYLYAINVSSAFTKPYQAEVVKTCDDITETEGIIILGIGAPTRVFAEGECVFIHGETEDAIIRAADRLVLTLLGVMDYS